MTEDPDEIFSRAVATWPEVDHEGGPRSVTNPMNRPPLRVKPQPDLTDHFFVVGRAAGLDDNNGVAPPYGPRVSSCNCRGLISAVAGGGCSAAQEGEAGGVSGPLFPLSTSPSRALQATSGSRLRVSLEGEVDASVDALSLLVGCAGTQICCTATEECAGRLGAEAEASTLPLYPLPFFAGSAGLEASESADEANINDGEEEESGDMSCSLKTGDDVAREHHHLSLLPVTRAPAKAGATKAPPPATFMRSSWCFLPSMLVELLGVLLAALR